MLRFFEKESGSSIFTQIPAAKDRCWIHADNATLSDLEAICLLTNLDLADVQDSLDRYEIPRIERLAKNVLLFLRYPIVHDFSLGLHTATLTVVMTEKYFITITPQQDDLIGSVLEKPSDLSPINPQKFLSHILMRVAQEFTSQIRRIRYNVLTQVKEMIHVQSEDIAALTRNEEVLNQYLHALAPLCRVLETMSSKQHIPFAEEDQDLVEDLVNATRQSEYICTVVVNSIRSLRDSYQIIFTNNLHKTIKLLTSLTILFSIPTMIASVYGMNIPLPFMSAPYAFIVLLGIISSISLAAFLFFRKREWL